jgi:hypothetical protein
MALQPRCGLEVLVSTWPADYSGAWTLASSVAIEGVGLHSGATAQVRLAPSPQPGYWLGWLDAGVWRVTSHNVSLCYLACILVWINVCRGLLNVFRKECSYGGLLMWGGGR